MTKKLEDLLKDFQDMTPVEQLEKVMEIRHTRAIERPKTAIKKQKKQAKKDDKSKGDIKSTLRKMSKEEREEFMKMLFEGQK